MASGKIFFSGLETTQRTSQSGVRLELFSAQLLTESQHPAQAGPSLANPKCLLATHVSFIWTDDWAFSQTLGFSQTHTSPLLGYKLEPMALHSAGGRT